MAVFGAEIAEGWARLWMERVRGRTLAAIVSEKGPLGRDEAILVGIDVAHALAAVHAAGIIHCDVKPSNVMRDDDGRTVLMDFGIGRRAGAAASQTAGTPAFMAPETLGGEPATVRSDVYMVGALLFALTTGTPPATPAAQRLHDARPDLPEPFVRAVERALDPDPARRWPSADKMAAALAVAFDLPGRRSRASRWLVVSTAVAVAAVFLALWARPPRRSEPDARRPSPAPTATPSPAATPPATAVAPSETTRARVEPFVAPVGSRGAVSDVAATPANANVPYSIRAAWHPGEKALELRASSPLSRARARPAQPARREHDSPPAHRDSGRHGAGTSPAGRNPGPLAAFEGALARSRVPLDESKAAGVPLAEEPLRALRLLEPPGAGTGADRPLFESAPPVARHAEIVQGTLIRVIAVP